MSRYSHTLLWAARMLSDWTELPGPADVPAGPVAWEDWYSLLFANELSCFAGARLDARQGAALPEAIAREVRADYLVQGCKAVHQAASEKRILDLLEGRVACTVLKGSALVPDYYREGAERRRVDLDLLFEDTPSAEAADRRLRSEGFKPSRDLPGHHHLPPLVHPAESLAVELHTDFSVPPLGHPVMAQIWPRRVRVPFGVGGSCWVLDPLGLLMNQCIHALNDPMGSVLLRNLFEVAWVSSRLSPEACVEAGTAIPAGRVREAVARVQHLAGELFGTPALFQRPRPGPVESWCRRKLGWGAEENGVRRVQKRVGTRQLEGLRTGSGQGLLPALLLECRDQARHLSPWKGGATARMPVRVDWPHVHAGTAVLVQDPLSGEVHVLNQLAAAVWLQADGRRSVRALCTALAQEGRGPGEVKEALRVLRAKGLLVRSGNNCSGLTGIN